MKTQPVAALDHGGKAPKAWWPMGSKRRGDERCLPLSSDAHAIITQLPTVTEFLARSCLRGTMDRKSKDGRQQTIWNVKRYAFLKVKV